MPAAPGRPLTALVLAAGLGKRMRSRTVKILHPLWGRPMLAWVLDAVAALAPERRVLVLGHQAEEVRAALASHDYQEVVQGEQLGTGHAVMTARPLLQDCAGDLLILNGDLPLLTGDTLRAFHASHCRSGAALSLLTTHVQDPAGYGRIVRRGKQVLRVVEHRDASASQRKINEINCGVYLARAALLLEALEGIGTANAQGEYYLTDVVEKLDGGGHQVGGIAHADAREVLGVNTRAELAEAIGLLGRRKLARLMDEGVTILDPAHTYIDPRVRIGRDTVVYPNVRIEGETSIGEDCILLSNSRLQDVRMGNGVTVKDSCVIQSAEIEDGAQVGPFAHLRPGTYLSQRVKVGNFVETKQAILGPGTKASHLSYLGDVETGENVNVGAGTITCNYDGRQKHRTVLEDGVFIGSDTQLVAPVRVGAGAYVGAGTTVTHDVPAGALAISRAPQSNLEGWVERKHRGKRGAPTGQDEE